jgi:hypothetical protein
MSDFLAIRDGGKSNEEAFMRFWRKVSSNGQGPLLSTDYSVGVHTPNNNSVDVAIGDIAIQYQGYAYHGWSDAVHTITIGANSSGNPRIDSIVAYIDLAVVSSASNNNPNAIKFIAVQGTPAGSPTAPNGTVVQAAVGAGNPYYVLGNVNVPNGFTSGSLITNSGTTIIVDQRSQFLVGQPPGLGFTVPGIFGVANDVGWNPSVPNARTFNKMSVHVKGAPTGSSATFRVWNITQTQALGSITVAASGTDADTTSLTNPSVNAGDRLRIDATAVGSTFAGNDASVTLY